MLICGGLMVVSLIASICRFSHEFENLFHDSIDTTVKHSASTFPVENAWYKSSRASPAENVLKNLSPLVFHIPGLNVSRNISGLGSLSLLISLISLNSLNSQQPGIRLVSIVQWIPIIVGSFDMWKERAIEQV